jgi:hypothetical protein
LNRHRGKGQQKVTVEHVHVHNGGQAYVDDQLLESAAKTAKAAFAKAIEWHVVGRLTDVSINDGIRCYSIAEFASVMALAEIANTVASAEPRWAKEGSAEER